MKISFLLIALNLFYNFFSIHLFLSTESDWGKWGRPSYNNDFLIVLILWLIILFLPVYILQLIFKLNLVALFFINIASIWILGPSLMKIYRWLLGSSKGPLRDMVTSLILAVIFFIAGLLVR